MIKKFKRSPKILKITLLTLSYVLAGVLTLCIYTTVNADNAIVDDFKGLTKADVIEWAEENNISEYNVSFEYEYSEEFKKDLIIDQSKKEGETLKSYQTLEITISKGGDPKVEFELIDFSNKPEEEIKKWFSDNQFTNVKYDYVLDNEKQTGDFISMNPEAGTKVKRSDDVTITICDNNITEVVVPDLMTYSISDIEAWASKHKITISYDYQYNEDVEENKIISVSSNAGDKISTGDAITVVISKGKESEESDANVTSSNNSINRNSSVNNNSNNNNYVSNDNINNPPSNNEDNSNNETTPTSACQAIWPNLYTGADYDIAANIRASQPNCTVVASYDNTSGGTGVKDYYIGEDGVMYITIYTK